MAPRKKEEPLANVAAEKALLGSLIRSPQSYWQIADTVKAEHFSVDFHVKLFSVIADILISQRTPSLSVLAARLPEDLDDGQSATAYVAALMYNAEGVSALDFADQVAETASRRSLIQISESMAKAARVGDQPAIEVAGEAEVALLDVMRLSAPKRPQRLSEITTRVIHAASEAKNSEHLPGFSTGLPPLDEIMGLILPGSLGFIIASQGDGKTALAAQIGMHAASTPPFKPVLMITMEMSDEQIAARELAAASGVTVREINEGTLDFAQFDALRDAEERLKKPEFWLLDEAELTVRQIAAHALGMKRTVGLGMVIVDQFDKVKAEGRFFKDRFERGSEVSRTLKRTAKESNVPYIVLAQRTRSAQRRDDPTPDILDADFPSIERDCDWALGLWVKYNWLRRNRPSASARQEEHDHYEMQLEKCRNRAEAISLKRRRGRPFEQRVLGWDGPRTRFTTLAGG